MWLAGSEFVASWPLNELTSYHKNILISLRCALWHFVHREISYYEVWLHPYLEISIFTSQPSRLHKIGNPFLYLKILRSIYKLTTVETKHFYNVQKLIWQCFLQAAQLYDYVPTGTSYLTFPILSYFCSFASGKPKMSCLMNAYGIQYNNKRQTHWVQQCVGALNETVCIGL